MPTINRAWACRAKKTIAHRLRTFALAALTLSCATVFGLVGLVGCVDASVDPSRVSARVVSAGEFTVRAGIPVFTESRTNIPCEVGHLFGVDYELEVAGGGSGLVPVQFKWIHTEVPVADSSRAGTETEGGVSNPLLKRGESRLLGRSLWSIDNASERVPGVYRFEIRVIGENRMLLSQNFEIEGC